MSNGKTHTQITYISGVAIFIMLVVAAILWKGVSLKFSVLFTLAYVFAGCMFSGDLDIKSVQSNRWGVLRWIWLPYRKLFSHRSKWTHGAVFGTVVRIVYVISVGVFMWVLVSVLAYINEQILEFMKHKDLAVIFSIIGQALVCIDKALMFVKGIFVNVTTKYPRELVIVLLGLIAGAFSHDLTDIIYSKRKAMKKRKKKKYRR